MQLSTTHATQRNSSNWLQLKTTSTECDSCNSYNYFQYFHCGNQFHFTRAFPCLYWQVMNMIIKDCWSSWHIALDLVKIWKSDSVQEMLHVPSEKVWVTQLSKNENQVDRAASSEMSTGAAARSPWTGLSQFLPTTQKLLEFSNCTVATSP